jgi:hypothetical protein
MTQDQNNRVSKKVFSIPDNNFTTNIELFRQTFTDVELLRRAKKRRQKKRINKCVLDLNFAPIKGSVFLIFFK